MSYSLFESCQSDTLQLFAQCTNRLFYFQGCAVRQAAPAASVTFLPNDYCLYLNVDPPWRF